MSPTYLKQYASKTDARVGIEFELLATNIQRFAEIIQDILESRVRSMDDVDRLASELLEYVSDQRAVRGLKSLRDDIKQDLSELINDLVNIDFIFDEIEKDLSLAEIDYDNFATNSVDELVSRGKITDNDREQFIDWLDSQDPDRYTDAVKNVEKLVNRMLDRELYSIADDEVSNQGAIYSQVYDNHYESNIDLYFEEFSSFNDVLRRFRIDVDNDPDDYSVEMDTIADDFAEFTNFGNVMSSGQYHGATEHNGWRVEPDSSIQGYGIGVEIISPPLPLDEMVECVHSVTEWAISRNYETNSTTGLHINVSVPGIENLDYIKLVVLLGDEHVLEQFGRESNRYAKSSFNAMRQYTNRLSSSDLPKLKADFVRNLMGVSKKFVRALTSEGKYVSVRLDDGYVEFRSPGGDWLNADIDKILDTVNRFATVLAIACDPDAFKEEYRSKFYKILEPYFVKDPELDYLLLRFTSGYSTATTTAAQIQNLINKQLSRRVSSIKIDKLSSLLSATAFIVCPPNMGFLAAVSRIQVVVLADSIDQVKEKYPNSQVFGADHPRIPENVKKLIGEIKWRIM